MRVVPVETGDPEKPHVAKVRVGGATRCALRMGVETVLGLLHLGGREQLIPLRNCESALPPVALLVRCGEGVGHFALLARCRLETASVQLWDVGIGIGRKGKGIIRGLLLI